MSLPKGYKRLEYIQSSGTQYIDTGFKPNQDTRIVCETEFKITSATEWLFGARQASNSNQFGFLKWNSAYRFDYGSAYYAYATSVAFVGKFTIDANKNVATLSGDATKTATYASFAAPVSLYLFANNNNGSVQGQTTAKIYTCQIYDNGTLVRDYVPCKNASGAVGLWDDAEGKFCGNAGTGTFTAGPTVPEIVDESEITELEYIQSSGTQYIETGFIPNQDTRVVMDFDLISVSSEGWASLFATRTDNSATRAFALFSNAAFSSAYDQYASQTLQPKVSLNGRHLVDKNKNTTSLDGTVISTFPYEAFTGDAPLRLLWESSATTQNKYPFIGKLNSCQIYDNGLLERDYIPAKLSNGEVGLYDRVFHEFYRNAGTGEFVAGPEMVHDGYAELEYIESNAQQYVNAGFYATQNTSVEGEAEFLSDENYPMLCGSYNSSSNQFAVFFNASKWNAWFGTSSVNFAGEYTGRKLFSLNKTKFAVNDDTAAISSSNFTAALPMFIFALHQSNAAYYQASLRLFRLNFWESDALIRAYIPMLHPSGVAGLWDEVNQRFYASATTTGFIAGPEAATAPKSPANFRVESEDGTLVTLAWDASEKAVGYRLYRSGQLLAETTETSVSVAVEPFAGAVFTLTAYNENGEGAGAELTYFNAPDDPILFLVTDRTQQDVTERNQKGYYTASDLNRVGFAVDYLQKRLLSAGVSVTVSPVLSWTDEEWATPTAMTAYLKDVQTMRNALKVAETTPTAPEDMANLTYSEANDIEAILVALDVHITRMLSIVDAGWASGLAYTGFYAKEAY